MRSEWLFAFIVVLLLLRLSSLRRFWRLPLKQGAGWFFTTEVGPDFYQGNGAALLRRYRGWLLAPLVPDAVAISLLILSGNALYILHEQFLASVLTAIFYNLLVYHFAYRARALTATTAQPATAAQLVLEPRRLRDYTIWPVEAVVCGLSLSAFALLASHRSFYFSLVWLLYLQAGLLMLKGVFVRWRMKLPLTRTADYQQWRAAWLTYHLRVFDAARVLVALAMLYLTVHETFEWTWQPGRARFAAAALWVVTIVLFITYCSREARRLARVQRAVQPATLVREFPLSPVAEGRFFAGGLLYFNPDHPVVMARSPGGLALNLAHRSTYVWIAYLLGLVLLTVWQISR